MEAAFERFPRQIGLYEPYAQVLGRAKSSWRLPPWLAPESPTDNWRTTAWH